MPSRKEKATVSSIIVAICLIAQAGVTDEKKPLKASIEEGNPQKSDNAKSDTERDDIAKGRRHWAFQPLAAPAPPSVRLEAWVRTPIDRFILFRLEEKGIVPNPSADRRRLIRRASLDLLGLPPSPD